MSVHGTRHLGHVCYLTSRLQRAGHVPTLDGGTPSRQDATRGVGPKNGGRGVGFGVPPSQPGPKFTSFTKQACYPPIASRSPPAYTPIMSDRQLQTAPVRGDNALADLAFEVALGYYTPDELQTRFDLSPTQFDHTTRTPAFQRAVQVFRRQIDEEGQEFRIKARKMASESLTVLFQIAGDDMADQADRIKAVEALCRYAGFDKGAESGPTNQAFVVNINLG